MSVPLDTQSDVAISRGNRDRNATSLRVFELLLAARDSGDVALSDIASAMGSWLKTCRARDRE
jgi:hypothetical protein